MTDRIRPDPHRAPHLRGAIGLEGADTGQRLGSGQGEREVTGIPGSRLPGPYPVGEYAQALRSRLRAFARVQLIGELVNLRFGRARVYFELRDSAGALPCAVWRKEWETISARASDLGEGMQIVVQGGCDYYPGSAASSPSFSFAVTDLRIAGEGDLLVRLERLRKALHAEGLLDRQASLLPLPALPGTIGIVCSATGKARHDLLAAFARRGWAGRIVWAYAPVQDRHAAPAITRALQDLAATSQVDVAIVARGGGSLADLLCFCDETLCRTVAMLPMPVVASVGHHTDRTLLDDVAALSCSTPTHAAEAVVAVDCRQARRQLAAAGARLRDHGRRSALDRAKQLLALIRAPSEQLYRQRSRLHQQLREIRASAHRRLLSEREVSLRSVCGLNDAVERRRREHQASRTTGLQRLMLALAAHEPERTLQRGYALVQDESGGLIGSAQAASKARRLSLRFFDGEVCAIVEKGDD